jgi:hypothetical protein
MRERSRKGTDLLKDPAHVRADLRLVARALREGWPVERRTLDDICRRIGGILRDGGTTTGARTYLRAAHAAIEAHRSNLRMLGRALDALAAVDNRSNSSRR